MPYADGSGSSYQTTVEKRENRDPTPPYRVTNSASTTAEYTNDRNYTRNTVLCQYNADGSFRNGFTTVLNVSNGTSDQQSTPIEGGAGCPAEGHVSGTNAIDYTQSKIWACNNNSPQQFLGDCDVSGG